MILYTMDPWCGKRKGNLAVTVLFSNDSDTDVMIRGIDSLVLACEDGIVADVSAEAGDFIGAGECLYSTFVIPPELIQTDSFSNVYVQELLFSLY